MAAIEAGEARSAAAGPAGLGAIEEEESDSENSEDNSGSDSDAEGGLPACPIRKHNIIKYCSSVCMFHVRNLTYFATELCNSVVYGLQFSQALGADYLLAVAGILPSLADQRLLAALTPFTNTGG